ncbi:uncharacterized protein Bfra_010635lb [Botrytis fragariae]|uniref:RING-type domain-containing protein n=1 Tax=Botrytis fragariae TaxID=1964551 RepID=A0A8H6ECT8_9HELO|nr:uncharacterized protein Bfra_010635lb [Botrytis fragariae]KAF5867661.1 hypothetical protein Bfra_010635lb [Botrytis fragariae]
MPPQRLDSRPHGIPPRDFRISENTTRPHTPMTPLTSTSTMISTMVATRGVTIEVISLNGDMSRTNPEFENIVRAAVDIAHGDDPRISSGELLIEHDLDEDNRFNAALHYHDRSMRSLSVKIIFDYTYRIKAINEMIELVDIETLDWDTCSICIESYTTATTLSERDTVVTTPEEPDTSDNTNGFEDSIDISNDTKDSITISNEPHHAAVKMKICGHVFGRRCITQWLKDNNTCPMCRRKVLLPIPFHLQMWVA